ncbi:hypothetical protein D3C86_1528400 [compost metagenome]
MSKSDSSFAVQNKLLCSVQVALIPSSIFGVQIKGGTQRRYLACPPEFIPSRNGTSARSIGLSFPSHLQNRMISRDLSSQMHEAGQPQVPIPERRVSAQQRNLLCNGSSRSKSAGLDDGNFRHTQLLPRVPQVSWRHIVAGMVPLRADGTKLLGR